MRAPAKPARTGERKPSDPVTGSLALAGEGLPEKWTLTPRALVRPVGLSHGHRVCSSIGCWFNCSHFQILFTLTAREQSLNSRAIRNHCFLREITLHTSPNPKETNGFTEFPKLSPTSAFYIYLRNLGQMIHKDDASQWSLRRALFCISTWVLFTAAVVSVLRMEPRAFSWSGSPSPSLIVSF